MKGHNTPGKAAACLAILREGPATTGEIAAELGMKPHATGTHMANLYKRGRVDRKPYGSGTDKLGRQRAWLWSIKEVA